MLMFILSGLHHNLILTKWNWGTWMFLYFMVSGAQSLVTVHQPLVLAAALDNDVIMPCQLKVSQDEKMLSDPVLYWERLPEESKLWPTTNKTRVDTVDKNNKSPNKSLLLKKVQWEDHGKYRCKLSITTKISFRAKGNVTLLMVYDTLIFNLTKHNDSLLRCEVNVSPEPGFVLSVFHNGCKPHTVDRAQGDVKGLPCITLSETVSLRGGGKYECQLQLKGDLVTKSVFDYSSPVSEEDVEKSKRPSGIPEPGEGVYPEPWLLYVALLLVPITILLSLITVMLVWRP